MRGALAVAAVVAGLALAISEAAMRPSPEERLALYAGFAAAAVVAGALAWWLTRIHRRLPSLRWTLLVVAVAAVVVAGGVVVVAATAMVLAPSEVRLVLAALALGTGLGVMVAMGVTGPLTTDLRRLSAAARQVADGDLEVATGVERADEVGALADSIDRMVGQLAALEAERLRDEAARRRLIAAIGHDLRTPLATLQAAAEALQDGVAADPDRYLRSMLGEVELLRGMVDDLLVLAGLEAGELRLELMEVDLSEVADGAVEALATIAARHDVTVRLDADGAVPVVADARALERVLRNLLDNSIRHTPRGGTVSVDLSADDGEATVRVRDDGPGFPPDFVDRAFDRFSRADEARERQRGGSGLGLAIARELLEAHGGTIWIEPAEGATVGFRLPVPRDRPVTDPGQGDRPLRRGRDRRDGDDRGVSP